MRHGYWGAILAIAVSAQSFGVTCERLNYEWKTKYHADFNVKWKNKTFECPSTASRIAQAFHDVATPRFVENKKGFAPDFYAFSKEYIKRTKYEGDRDECDAVARMSSTGTMTICPDFKTSAREWVAATIVHEAAHNRPEDRGHVKCKHGSKKGDYACDRVFNEGFKGSGYNYAFMYHWWISSASTYRELDLEVSRGLMRYLLLNRFNKIPEELAKKWIS